MYLSRQRLIEPSPARILLDGATRIFGKSDPFPASFLGKQYEHAHTFAIERFRIRAGRSPDQRRIGPTSEEQSRHQFSFARIR